MRTISTKILSTSNTKGTRVKATVSEGKESITMSYDHGLNADKNHMAVATALAEKLGWRERLLGGHTDGGMVFVVNCDLSRSLYTIGA